MNPSDPGSPPLPAHLLRRRRTLHRLRRAPLLPTPAPALPVAAGASAAPPAAPAQDHDAMPPELAAMATEAAELLSDMTARSERLDAELLEANARGAMLEARLAEAEGLAAPLEEARREIQRLNDDLAASRKAHEELTRTLDEARAVSARARQDLEILRRRSTKEKEDLRRFAAEETVRQLLPLLDHFGFAQQTHATGASAEAMLDGFLMIFREVDATLRALKVEPVRDAGVPFNPQHHDAVSTVEDPAQPDGVVVQVVRTGYVLDGKTLRPAMVSVNKLPSAAAPQPTPRGTPGLKPLPLEVLAIAPPPAVPPPNEPVVVVEEPSGTVLYPLAPPPEVPAKASESGATPLERARRILDTRHDV